MILPHIPSFECFVALVEVLGASIYYTDNKKQFMNRVLDQVEAFGDNEQQLVACVQVAVLAQLLTNLDNHLAGNPSDHHPFDVLNRLRLQSILVLHRVLEETIKNPYSSEHPESNINISRYRPSGNGSKTAANE